MTITKACRPYTGLRQKDLADRAGVTVAVMAADDFTSLPADFFHRWPEPDYGSAPTERHKRIGREGEEYIFAQKKERVNAQYPTLSRLVMPFFKMRGKYGAGIRQSALSLYESGKREPTLAVLRRISRETGATLDELAKIYTPEDET